ncbi:MAG TPA: hypothetical protein VMG10_10945 [Gemmataceae bacterium]|nr:hypothetical protein [Gemmataceae bacterium]
MTLLTKPDNRVICRIQLTGEGRWVRLALSLGGLAPASRFLIYSEPLLYEMAGVDEMAREYGLSSWQGGVISGARYAFRALKAPLQQVCLHELRGQLGSGDVGAVSSAAALAVARLLARPAEFPLNLEGWTSEEETSHPQPAEGISQSGKMEPSPPEPTQENVENHSRSSGNTDSNEATRNLSD